MGAGIGRIGGIDKTGSLLHLMAEFRVPVRRIGRPQCARVAASGTQI